MNLALRPPSSRRTVDDVTQEYRWGPKWDDGCSDDDLIERAAIWGCWCADPVPMTPEEWWEKESPQGRDLWRSWARDLFEFIGAKS